MFQKIKFDQHRECNGCTHADSTGSDADGPPELDWTPHNSDDAGPPGLHPSTDEHDSESEDESQDERDDAAPLGHNETKTIAQYSARETLSPKC